MIQVPNLDAYSGSWIVSLKTNGLAVLETFDRATAESVDQTRYNVETAYQYLARFNREIKEAKDMK